MQQRDVKLVSAALLTGSTLLLFAGGAVASSSSFKWTMDHRYVSGERNKKFYNLSAGVLTLNGSLWITLKRAAAASAPLPISIMVVKQGSTERNATCTVTVIPDTVVNAKKAFSKSCGRIDSGEYFVVINKDGANNPDGDGWHNQGSGTLSTD
jgi:hypothetical protein